MPLRFVIACWCSFIAVAANAADWPQWRGPEHTGHVPAGEQVPAKLPMDPKVVWRIKIGDGIAGPVVADGRVYYLDNQGGREALHAVGTAGATEAWVADLDQAVGNNQSVPGPRCAPVADGNRVYAQSMLGELRCFDAANGHQSWTVSYVKDFRAPPFVGEKGNAPGATRHGYTASPLIMGDTLYALPGAPGASVVAFDKTSGKVSWKSQDDGAAYAAPVVAVIGGERTLIAFTVEGVIGLSPGDGKLLWRVPLQTSLGRHAVTPVVIGDTVVAGSYTLGLIGIRVTHEGGGWQATRAWTSKESAVNFACPVAVGEYLYGLGPEKNIFCVEVKTGRRAWSQPGLISSSADKAFAGLLALGGNILALTDTGELALFPADPKGYADLGRAQVCGKNWCNPAYRTENCTCATPGSCCVWICCVEPSTELVRV